MELPNVVVSADPFHSTAEPETKLVPTTESVKAEPPAVAEAGLKLLTVSPLIVNVAGLVLSPPGSVTVTFTLPELAMRLAGTVAANCVELKKAVVSALPFHCTVELETKPFPFTMSVKAGPPGEAASGLRLVTARALIVKESAMEAGPPGLLTATVAMPAAPIRLAGTVALTCVALT